MAADVPTPSEPEQGGSPDEVPPHVVEAARSDSATRTGPPEWISQWVRQSLWKVVAVGLATTVLLVAAWRAQHLIRLLALSLFFALAIIPGVQHLHDKRGWKRGAAVGVIYAGLILSLVLMVVLLIPGIATFASEIGENGNDWVQDLNSRTQDAFGKDLIGAAANGPCSRDCPRPPGHLGLGQRHRHPTDRRLLLLPTGTHGHQRRRRYRSGPAGGAIAGPMGAFVALPIAAV